MNVVDQNTVLDDIDFLKGSVILIDKDKDWTSFDAVNKLRWAIKNSYEIKKVKVGHAGTLDPMATGLLIICTGKMTKSIDTFQGLNKKYSGTICLGATTPSYDAETEVNERFELGDLKEEYLKEIASKFVGKLDQVPPIYSALKINGVPNYKRARRGEEIKLKSRPVEIFSFNLTKIALPYIDFEMECSKGTYVRSLAYDFGRALNNGGYLSALRRESIGDYNVGDGLSVEQLAEEIRSKKRVSELANK